VSSLTPDIARAQLQLWQTLGIVTLTTVAYIASSVLFTKDPVDFPTIMSGLAILLTAPALTLAGLCIGFRHLASYSAIAGILTSGLAACFVLWLTLTAPSASLLLQLFVYSRGIALAAAYGYTSLAQISVARAIHVPGRKRLAALRESPAPQRLKL
jgi:hypothetical protein